MAIDAAGYVYVAGGTDSPDFPTRNAYQGHQGPDGSADAFVTRLDIRPVTISGKVILQGCLHPQDIPLTLKFRPTDDADAFTLTTSLASDGTFSVQDVPANSYHLAFKGSKWLQKVVSVDASKGSVSGVNVTLLPGDINNDNKVNLSDLGVLADAFNSTPASPNWNANADLDGNGRVNIRDLGLLADNFGKSGDP
jgi:hypothetical protein